MATAIKSKATSKVAKPKLPKAPKPTAAERKARQLAEQEAAEQARKAAWAAFDAIREATWNGIWVKAMRLELILRTHDELNPRWEAPNTFRERSGNSWWFEDFWVDAWNQQFSCQEMASGTRITMASLHPSDVSRINQDLDLGLQFVQEFLDEKERERLAAIELENKRKVARSKLTAEDLKVLGL